MDTLNGKTIEEIRNEVLDEFVERAKNYISGRAVIQDIEHLADLIKKGE